jgi:pyrroloquinoline-quinone synthase
MRSNELDVVVAAHDINQHPFYRAWRAGTLPLTALARYASDYAPFIGAIENGWSRIGEAEHAATEREHAALWEQFRAALGPSKDASCPEADALSDEARRSFGDPAAALGALYAFEAQQPSTAQSKLDGLLEHYALGDEALAYFRHHASDYGERELLGKKLEGLAEGSLSSARAACERTCRAMWTALDGILSAGGHTAHCQA